MEVEVPGNVGADLAVKCQEMALETFKRLGCSGMARVDFPYDRTSGELFVSEINTMLGLTSKSLFRRMCELEGL